MEEKAQDIAQLIYQSLAGLLPAEQESVLQAWLSKNAANKLFYEQLQNDGKSLEANGQHMSDLDQARKNIYRKIQSETDISFTLPVKPIDFQNVMQSHQANPVRKLVRRMWIRYAAAILIILTGVAIYYISVTPRNDNKVAQTTPSTAQKDFPPGSERAILTLSDGRKVELNSAASETILDEDMPIENRGGNLSYKKGNFAVLNTMTTPRGGKYQLTLADGTRVWLNANSSITYPTVFEGKTREVTITGEAYFDVAKNAQKPFLVNTRSEKIEVLGTEFNVNIYEDQTPGKISLVSGSVKIGGKQLQPGQAYVNGEIIKTDIDKDIAWLKGLFNFNGTYVKEALRQLSRWYDVEIVYEGSVPEIELIGEIGRDLSLSQIMKMLEDRGLRYRIESERRRVIILP